MTNTTNLNELAVAAKTNEGALWEIKAHFMPFIERMAADNWYKMNNEVDFINDANRRIEYAVRSYDPNKGNFENRVNTLIEQGVRHYCGKRGTKRKVLTSMDAIEDASNATFAADDVEKDDDKKSSKRQHAIIAADDVEATVIDSVQEIELINKYSETEMDEIILGIILGTKDVLNQSELTRQLAEKTGRSFDSARGAVRGFLKRKRQQVKRNAA
ncbi:hypothetical protein ACE41F_26655 [Bacillus cereus]|uniref:hypothetical protein n=1 Tax=Bacillus cereus TaxID=1396 RepID=UPI0035CAFEB2